MDTSHTTEQYCQWWNWCTLNHREKIQLKSPPNLNSCYLPTATHSYDRIQIFYQSPDSYPSTNASVCDYRSQMTGYISQLFGFICTVRACIWESWWWEPWGEVMHMKAVHCTKKTVVFTYMARYISPRFPVGSPLPHTKSHTTVNWCSLFA